MKILQIWCHRKSSDSLRELENNGELFKSFIQREFVYRLYKKHISQGLWDGDLERRLVCNRFKHNSV